MINQKGQAFSVFELMIAGVVAFAILMVLMQVIGGVLTGQDTDALTALSGAVDNASPSGQSYSGSFVLQKDLAVRATNLANETDLDKESFIFVPGEFASDPTINVENGDHITYTSSTGALPTKKIAAIVICEQTNQDLADAISSMDSSKYDFTNADAGCANDGIVCCVIIPTRPTR